MSLVQVQSREPIPIVFSFTYPPKMSVMRQNNAQLARLAYCRNIDLTHPASTNHQKPQQIDFIAFYFFNSFLLQMCKALCHAGYSEVYNFNSHGYPQKPWITRAKPDTAGLPPTVHKLDSIFQPNNHRKLGLSKANFANAQSPDPRPCRQVCIPSSGRPSANIA